MELTIKMFQDLNLISNMDIDEEMKSRMLVKTFTDKTDLELDKMPAKEYGALCRHINKSFDLYNSKMLKKIPKALVKANGKWYKLNYDIAKAPMNAGRYVEFATFSKDMIPNLHKIMATISTPMRRTLFGFKPIERKTYFDHELISLDMLHMDFAHAYHAAVFFWAVFSKSILNSRSYFQSIATEQTKLDQVLNDLQNLSVGFSQAKWYQNLKV